MMIALAMPQQHSPLHRLILVCIHQRFVTPVQFAMSLHRPSITVFAIALVLVAAVGAYLLRDRWLFRDTQSLVPNAASPSSAAESMTGKVIVSEPAQKNLGIVAKPLVAEVYWKSVVVPGMVLDRPGVSDREIVSPAVGTISQIHHVPGDTVQPGETLFTLKLLSDTVQQSETGLYKASQEMKIAESQRQRLVTAGQGVAGYRLIEAENEIKRLQTSIEAYRYELSNHGLSDTDIAGVADGRFVAEITVSVPATIADDTDSTAATEKSAAQFEVQKLEVGVGQQVQAGATLCLLSNHATLAIEGRAFRDEAALVERSVKEGWPAEVDFLEESNAEWPTMQTSLPIIHVSNVIDPTSRTFAFLMPVQNQSQAVKHDGKEQLIWRLRPGQKVRIKLRTDKLDNVFVLPAAAVVREGPDAFIFTQNVNTFERKGVHVLFQDRDSVVIANDGTLPTYTKDGKRLTLAAVVRGAAAQLGRMSKSSKTAVPQGYHIHADGSLHKNEDEGK